MCVCVLDLIPTTQLDEQCTLLQQTPGGGMLPPHTIEMHMFENDHYSTRSNIVFIYYNQAWDKYTLHVFGLFPALKYFYLCVCFC